MKKTLAWLSFISFVLVADLGFSVPTVKAQIKTKTLLQSQTYYVLCIDRNRVGRLYQLTSVPYPCSSQPKDVLIGVVQAIGYACSRKSLWNITLAQENIPGGVFGRTLSCG